MIAPVYTQNAKFLPDGTISEAILPKGHHYVEIALAEVPLFIRSGRCIPVAEAAETVEEVSAANLQMIGYPGADYTLYEDDGIHKSYEKPEDGRVLRME